MHFQSIFTWAFTFDIKSFQIFFYIWEISHILHMQIENAFHRLKISCKKCNLTSQNVIVKSIKPTNIAVQSQLNFRTIHPHLYTTYKYVDLLISEILIFLRYHSIEFYFGTNTWNLKRIYFLIEIWCRIFMYFDVYVEDF